MSTSSLSALICAVFACTAGSQVPPEAPAPTPARSESQPAADSRFADASNTFAIDLWNQLQDDQKEPGNRVVSPASVSLALAMTAGGAAGSTAEQVAKVLHADDLDAYTTSAAAQLAAWSAADQPYELVVANRLFGDRSTAFVPAFVDLTGGRFGAPLEPVDFAGAPEPSRATINGWIADRTHQHIPSLLPSGSVTGDTRLVLANAIWFDGTWATAFDPAATAPATFRAPGGGAEVPMMHQTGSFAYAALDDAQVLELPYEGGHLVMDLVLPRTDEPIGALDAGDPSRWLSALKPAQVAVSMPRLELRPDVVDLKATLGALGMAEAFTDAADFSGMSTAEDLHLDGVFHQSFVQLDETGTKAAAATAVTMVRETAMARPDPVESFVADHPFLFLIRDTRTGAVLFLGEVVSPGA